MTLRRRRGAARLHMVRDCVKLACRVIWIAWASAAAGRARGQEAVSGARGVEVRPLSAPAARHDDASLFELLAPDRTGVDFRMQLPDPKEHIREYTLLSVYGGLCTGDYDGDGLADFYVTSPVEGNRLYRNLGDFRFRDVTVEAGVHAPDMQGSGATFVDVDNDGDLDIHACAYGSENRLFVNRGPNAEGAVRFEEQARQFGLAYNGASMTMAFADLDNDGDLDGYLATTAMQPPPGVSFKVRFEGNKPVVLDSLREYWQLIYLPGERAHPTEAGQFDHLFRNDGSRFTEISQQAGLDGAYFTLSASWWDYNRDGLPDLYVANDFLGPDALYRNDGDGRFTNVGPDVLPHTPWFSMGTDVADVNNDGHVDLLATDMLARSRARRMQMSGDLESSRKVLDHIRPQQYLRNALYLNTGGDRVFEASYQYGVARTDWTWCPRLADFDNDGFVDLFVTTGVLRDTMNADSSRIASERFAPGSQAWRNFWASQGMRKEANVALKNREGRRFEDVSAAWGLGRVGVSYGAATADFDNDGNLDLIVNNVDAPLSIYRNRGSRGASVRIELRGRESNRFGVGATVVLENDGVRQAQYMTLARGWLSGVEPAVHFGLGESGDADSLTVYWPSGQVQRVEGVEAGNVYTIAEPDSAAPPRRPTQAIATRTMFVRTKQNTPAIHTEFPYDDYADQPLLPYRLSEPGPALCWGDIDGDGDTDGFLGGSRGRPGRLLGNAGQSQLVVVEPPEFKAYLQSEIAAACFFDADGDGDQDLYAATGSIERPPGDEAYGDILYLNDGGGGFERAPDGSLPDFRDSASTVVAGDVDNDGDIDLFVGSRCVPGKYPERPENRLLVNEQGKFRDAAPPALRDAGMTTDAAWADVDGDGWLDLVVTTDWGPVRLFANEQGALVERTEEAGLARRLGWWLAIAPGDLDGDGDVDFAVTNFGRNTHYSASAEAPALLYYGDFEGLGKPQIIEAAHENGVRYPLRELLAMKAAMPSLEAVFDEHSKYAAAAIEDVVGADPLRKATRLEVNELDSGVLYNQGDGTFRFEPLPDLAQIAPALDVTIADVNGDFRADLVLAQNFFSAHREGGRFDGGLGLVVLGRPDAKWEALWPSQSGVVVPQHARSVTAVDLDGDRRLDLVFGVQGELAVFRNAGGP